MAEKTSYLRSVDKLDPAATAAGAKSGEFLEKYSEDYSETERGELENVDAVPEETEQIKARIEATRNQMGETIDAIQERLSFANISEQVSDTVSHAIETAKDTAYDATIGKAVNFMKNVGDGVTHSNTFSTVRKNPLPYALIGVGAGLLAYQGFSKRGFSQRGSGRHLKLHDGIETAANDASTTIGSAKKSLTGVASKAYEGLSDKASSALGTVGDAAGSAYDGVAGAVTSVYAGAGDVANRAYDRAGEYGAIAHEKYDQYLEENPLALGALAVAVGAAVGFAIPSTRYEGELMGNARDNLMERVHDATGSFVNKAKQMATDAGQTIQQEVQSLNQ